MRQVHFIRAHEVLQRARDKEFFLQHYTRPNKMKLAIGRT